MQLNDGLTLSDLKLVPIPAGQETINRFTGGRFWLSSNSMLGMPLDQEKKVEAVTYDIAPFLLMSTPVTVGQFHAVEQTAFNRADAHKPFVNISWMEVLSFCNRLSLALGRTPVYQMDPETGTVQWDQTASGMRLPTEAEWQYACRAGHPGYRYGVLNSIAWYRDNAGGAVHDVGHKQPNAWGLYDMLGNVWEWCWDLYDAQVYGDYRVFRGGSWADSGRSSGVTVRRGSFPTFQIDDLGFRLACNANMLA